MEKYPDAKYFSVLYVWIHTWLAILQIKIL